MTQGTKGAFGAKKFLMVNGYAVGIVRPTRHFGSTAKQVKGIKKYIAKNPHIDEPKNVRKQKGIKGFMGRVFQRKGE